MRAARLSLHHAYYKIGNETSNPKHFRNPLWDLEIQNFADRVFKYDTYVHQCKILRLCCSILAGPRLYVSLDELSALLIMRSIR